MADSGGHYHGIGSGLARVDVIVEDSIHTRHLCQ
jgi:hypothetical protein